MTVKCLQGLEEIGPPEARKNIPSYPTRVGTSPTPNVLLQTLYRSLNAKTTYSVPAKQMTLSEGLPLETWGLGPPLRPGMWHESEIWFLD